LGTRFTPRPAATSQPLARGRQVAAQETALPQSLQPRLPLLGAAAQPVEDLVIDTLLLASFKRS